MDEVNVVRKVNEVDEVNEVNVVETTNEVSKVDGMPSTRRVIVSARLTL